MAYSYSQQLALAYGSEPVHLAGTGLVLQHGKHTMGAKPPSATVFAQQPIGSNKANSVVNTSRVSHLTHGLFK